jgi:hypothetical protein
VLDLVNAAISALAQLLPDCVIAETLTDLKNGGLLEPEGLLNILGFHPNKFNKLKVLSS